DEADALAADVGGHGHGHAAHALHDGAAPDVSDREDHGVTCDQNGGDPSRPDFEAPTGDVHRAAAILPRGGRPRAGPYRRGGSIGGGFRRTTPGWHHGPSSAAAGRRSRWSRARRGSAPVVLHPEDSALSAQRGCRTGPTSRR